MYHNLLKRRRCDITKYTINAYFFLISNKNSIFAIEKSLEKGKQQQEKSLEKGKQQLEKSLEKGKQQLEKSLEKGKRSILYSHLKAYVRHMPTIRATYANHTCDICQPYARHMSTIRATYVNHTCDICFTLAIDQRKAPRPNNPTNKKTHKFCVFRVFRGQHQCPTYCRPHDSTYTHKKSLAAKRCKGFIILRNSLPHRGFCPPGTGEPKGVWPGRGSPYFLFSSRSV